MKTPLFLLIGVILSVTAPLYGQEPVQSVQMAKPDKDQQRKEYFAQLDRVYKAVPTAAKMEKGINEMMAVLLTVEDAASAAAAAQKIKVMDQNSKALAEPFSKEVKAYSEGKSRTDLGLRTLMSTLKKQGNDIMAIIESTRTQGNMTKELTSALNLTNVLKPVAACPPMSAEVSAYWKKEFAQLNRLNRVLFSLQEKKDISRVAGELKEIQQLQNETKKMKEALYPLKVESDAAGNAEMSRRLQNGPVRVLNHMLSIVSSRGFIDSKDPVVQDIGSLIREVTR